MPKATQTNVQAGDFVLIAGEVLTEKEARLALVGNAGGKAVAKLPAAITDHANCIITEGAAIGANVILRPLDSRQQVRIVLKGTCNPGDRLTMADPSTATDAGKVRTVPVANGTYIVVAIAEELGVDGQHVKARPYGPLAVTNA